MMYNSVLRNKFSSLSKMLKCSFIFGLSLCLYGCSSTDDYEIFAKIQGTITDYRTGVAIENASITLSPSGLSKQTDANGFYRFEDLDAGQYTITVQKSGYQPNRKTLMAISGETQQVDIQLIIIP